MKIIKNQFFICILFLLSGLENYATTCYDQCGTPYDCAVGPPAPICDQGTLTINENILILLSLALLFGIYLIYKNQQSKKTAK